MDERTLVKKIHREEQTQNAKWSERAKYSNVRTQWHDTYLKDPVDMFSGGVRSDHRLGILAHQVVDCRDDVEQIVVCNDPVTVRVIQTERPQQLLFDRAARQHRQTRHELLHASDINSYSPVSIQTQSLALRALRLDENRAKRKCLRWQAANHGCHCFDRASYWLLLRRRPCGTVSLRDDTTTTRRCRTAVSSRLMHLWPCDLDLWTFELLFINGQEIVMEYPNYKFRDCTFSHFSFIALNMLLNFLTLWSWPYGQFGLVNSMSFEGNVECALLCFQCYWYLIKFSTATEYVIKLTISINTQLILAKNRLLYLYLFMLIVYIYICIFSVCHSLVNKVVCVKQLQTVMLRSN